MANNIFGTLILCGIMILMMSLPFWPVTNGNAVVVKYDCSMLIGGWHPDVPAKVQEACKKRELNK